MYQGFPTMESHGKKNKASFSIKGIGDAQLYCVNGVHFFASAIDI